MERQWQDQTNLFFSLLFFFFFRSRFKDQLHALDSFDLAIGVPQMIQFTYDTLSPLLSRSVQYKKFEYINIKKVALNYKKIKVQRPVNLSCVVKIGHIEYH